MNTLIKSVVLAGVNASDLIRLVSIKMVGGEEGTTAFCSIAQRFSIFFFQQVPWVVG